MKVLGVRTALADNKIIIAAPTASAPGRGKPWRSASALAGRAAHTVSSQCYSVAGGQNPRALTEFTRRARSENGCLVAASWLQLARVRVVWSPGRQLVVLTLAPPETEGRADCEF